MPSNRWNLSTDYYDVLPADSEMDGESERCDYCDGIVNDEGDYYIPKSELCDGGCNDE